MRDSNTMKRTLFKIGLFGVLITFCYAFAILVPYQGKNQNSLYANLDKMARLRSIETPRLILIGGSNVSFGLNSEQIQKETGCEVINLGLHAGVGLNFMIKQVIDELRANDLVILCPEYQQLTTMFYGSDELLTMTCDVDPSLKSKLSKKQVSKLINEMPSYVGRKYFQWAGHYLPQRKKANSLLYTRQQFNKYGDAVAHHDMKRKKVKPKPISDIPNKDYLNVIENYRRQILEKNAHIAFSYPAHQYSSFSASGAFIEGLEKEIDNIFTPQEIINSPSSEAFADSLFFDTPYHLTLAGKTLRTEQFIANLKEHLALGGKN